MQNLRNENNLARISGKVATEPEFSHESFGEGFYYFSVDIARTSGSFDRIPVMLSERLASAEELRIGSPVYVEGQFRSHNMVSGDRSKLQLMLFAREFVAMDDGGDVLSVKRISEYPDEESPLNIHLETTPEENKRYGSDMNEIVLDGFICKQPNYRVTPLKREITDILLAVNRLYNKSDYIPCICWGRNARFCGRLCVGDNVRIQGRIQSRAYQKRLPDGTSEERTAFEVSISGLEVLKSTKEV